MKKTTHYSLLVFSFLVLLTGCSKDVFDEYYERPESLEPPIYQQLEAKGNFKNLTALIQKAKYKDILSKAGYWTMMAPNDDAFTQFFQKEGISDVTKIDSVTASKIVKYALVYNAFRLEQLSDYQSAIGWEVDNSFRRRTAFYDGFLNKTVNGKPIVIVGSNRNNRGATTYYVNGDNNNKYLSYFEKEYFATKNLSTYDYNFFYPNSNFTNANVLGGHIEEADIIAENGVIHEVSQVSVPLLNLDQYLESNPNYSLFRSIVENNLVTYNFNQDATTAYRNYTGKSDQVFVKVYDATLAFSPNNENYLKQSDNDGQMDAYTLFVPDNNALQQFINTVLLKNYASIDKLPKYIFQDLVNAHMVPNAVWPSKVSSYNNALGEEIRFNFATDVKDAKVASNGFFYGTNKIQESNLFYTVYTSAYLDPKFTLATRLFNDGSGFREIVSDISQKYTLFLPSDAVLRSLGYDFNINRNEWMYTNPVNGAVATASIARSNLMRVLYNGIIPTPNGELNNLAGSGIIRSGDLDIPGEYIKWNNNKVFAAGNITPATVIGFEDKRNGRTYYIDKLIQFSEEAHGLTLKKLATANTNFSHFYNYLAQSTLYKIGDWIEGVEIGTSYTFIVPSNAAISQAVKDGVLPGTVATGVPNFNPALQGDKDLVADFIRYHIIATKTVSDDGLSEGLVETLRKDTFGEKTFIQINSAPGTLSFKDSAGRTANFIKSSSNNLADRTLIHLVDNYLLYKQ
ncbi:fasciclin domain-containing protein [Flavobacterium aquidurense]|uniref:fasciclin domain-containing protein n=1 Tax=Flavobacterium aquidurense TaxID=362413 RepID=UPI002860E8FD|nr:fasciclin domain-containing protein [Flavobacterium aquidurense]MDR7370195.1 putative surface protein with fasciclin (FAS1) repeats [Flavobacterium aquidurense]